MRKNGIFLFHYFLILIITLPKNDHHVYPLLHLIHRCYTRYTAAIIPSLSASVSCFAAITLLPLPLQISIFPSLSRLLHLHLHHCCCCCCSTSNTATALLQMAYKYSSLHAFHSIVPYLIPSPLRYQLMTVTSTYLPPKSEECNATHSSFFVTRKDTLLSPPVVNGPGTHFTYSSHHETYMQPFH